MTRIARLLALALLGLFSTTAVYAQSAWWYYFPFAPTNGYRVLSAATGSADEAARQRFAANSYVCSSWAYSYGESQTGNVTGPQSRRILNGTELQYPIRGDNCTNPNNTWDTKPKIWHPIGSGVMETVCDSGFALTVSTGSNTATCRLPTTPPPSSGSGAGRPDKGTIPSACSEDKCDSTLPSNDGTPMVGDPINLTNGNVFSEQVDYRGAGGNRLVFARFYNSISPGYGQQLLGLNWRHTYSYRLINASTYALLVRPDGQEIPFTFSGGSYTAPATHTGRLAQSYPQTANDWWRYTLANGDVERYDSVGRIVRLDRAKGGSLVFTWADTEALSSVTDGLGRTISFTYGGAPARLTSVTFPDQTSTSFSYSAAGQLVSATHSSGTTRQYAYMAASGNSAKLLQSIVNEDGNTSITFTYDSSFRGTSAVKPGNVRGVWLTYGSGTATVTNALGYRETHELSTSSGTSQATLLLIPCDFRGSAACGGGSDTKRAAYDSAGNMTEFVDEGGILTCTSYLTSRGLPTKRVSGLLAGSDSCASALSSPPAHARVETFSWHGSMTSLLKVSEPLRITTFTLDAAGRPTTISRQATSDVTGAAGFAAAAVGSARNTVISYTAQGFVASVKEPRGDVNATTSYGYDSAQNLVSITDPTGLTTTLGSYDANGRPGLVTEPNGLQTTLAYDSKGRITQSNTGGALTSYSYTPSGRVASVSLPTGVTLSYSYDLAGRVVGTSDSLGNSITLTLDVQGNVLSERLNGNGGALAFSRQMAYDALSRLQVLTKAQ